MAAYALSSVGCSTNGIQMAKYVAMPPEVEMKWPRCIWKNIFEALRTCRLSCFLLSVENRCALTRFFLFSLCDMLCSHATLRLNAELSS